MSWTGSLRSLRLEIEVAPEFEDSNAVASRVAYHLREALGLERERAGRRIRDAAALRDESQSIRRRSMRSYRTCRCRIPNPDPESRIPDPNPDVVVIGGGPSGSTAATLFADAGRSLELIDGRIPAISYRGVADARDLLGLQRLGMLPKLEDSHFVKKYSVQFVTPRGASPSRSTLRERDPHECSQTWQVLRSKFDEMMLDNAASMARGAGGSERI